MPTKTSLDSVRNSRNSEDWYREKHDSVDDANDRVTGPCDRLN